MRVASTLKLTFAVVFLPILLAIATIFFINLVFAQDTIDLAAGEQDLTIYGGAPRSMLTTCAGGCDSGIASGDFNGDGIKDILTNASFTHATGRDVGIAYVFFGSTTIGGIIDLALGEPDITILPQQSPETQQSSELGSESNLAGADINGDGIDDIILGAFHAEEGQPSGIGSGIGKVYIIFGSPSLSGTIDLATTPPNVIIKGAERHDSVGTSLAAGDVNGDGVKDILVGASGADGPGSSICGDVFSGFDGTGDRCFAGEAYVFFGSASWPATIDLATTSPNLTIYGDETGGSLGGVAIAAGDVNNDGVEDILVTGRQTSISPGVSKVYAIFGSSTLSGVRDISLGQQDLTISAGDNNFPSPRIRSVVSGDINGDGVDDILVGAQGDGPGTGDCGFGRIGDRCGAGELYAIFGSPALSGAIDLASTSPDLTIFGKDFADNIGLGLAAGDVNGDGIEDILITAPGGDGPGTGTSCGEGQIGDRCSNAGEVYAIFGSPALSGAIDLASTSPDLTIFGADPLDIAGLRALASGDINGDGIDDILAGARAGDGPGTGTSCGEGQIGDRCGAGELYAIFGKSADSDGDGVPNAQDSCPTENATGFDANKDGCIDTVQGLIQVIVTLPDGTLSDQLKNSLVSKVENAQKSSDKSNICAGVNQLQAFINEVDGQRGKKISDEAANDLIAYAQSVTAALNSQLPAGETC